MFKLLLDLELCQKEYSDFNTLIRDLMDFLKELNLNVNLKEVVENRKFGEATHYHFILNNEILIFKIIVNKGEESWERDYILLYGGYTTGCMTFPSLVSVLKDINFIKHIIKTFGLGVNKNE